MPGGIETLPLSILQEILNGRLRAEDLARLESCSSLFQAPCGIGPCEAKSMAEAAAHHSCQTHPVFENLPPHARLMLLAKCNGHWKQVLYFLECLLRIPGRSTLAGAPSNVVALAGLYHTLIVNGNAELYITSRADILPNLFRNVPPEPQSTLRLIFSQPTANRILQISANHCHAAFVTETGQVFTFGKNWHCCCGVGLEIGEEIRKPTLVTALEMTPCQQVTTGIDFTIALTRSGVLHSWGRNEIGQLGQGHTRDESTPQEVIVQSGDGAPDPVVQVSSTVWHVVAVTKAGRLFTWGGHIVTPKRVVHRGFAGLFIVYASTGYYYSAAIDSFGLVYTWSSEEHSCTPLLVNSLKVYRAVQVVANPCTLVVLDNGQVHYFKIGKLQIEDQFNKEDSGSFTIRGQKIQSIASSYNHGVIVTMR